MKKVLYNALYALFALGVIVGVWCAVHACVGNELILPSLSASVKAMGALFVKRAFWRAFLHSLLRVVIAFAISFVLAGGFALISYLYPIFGRIFAPIVAFFRSLPTLCVLLLILLWTDAGVAPVVVAFLSLFPVLYAGLYAGLCAVDLKLVEMSKVYRVPLGKQIAKLYIPSVLPYAVREGTAGMSFALKLVVSAEVLAGTYKSIGFQMQEAKTYLETPTLFALVIVTFLLGLFLEAVGALLVQAVERGRV